MRWTVPNILTVFRLLAAPLVAVAFLILARPYADIAALTLFAAASLTDWLDGYLARAWRQMTKLGTMLDPIADKAMVIIACAAILTYSSLAYAIVLPIILILFREVFVSGLREYLGDVAGALKVTKLAKWKTTIQMVALAVLFAHGIFEHYLTMASWGLGEEMTEAMLTGQVEDTQGLVWKLNAMTFSGYGGIGLIWLAALLTVLTGWDYFQKSLPYLEERE